MRLINLLKAQTNNADKSLPPVSSGTPMPKVQPPKKDNGKNS